MTLTLQQITNLSPEELRIKCAEAEDPSVKICYIHRSYDCCGRRLPELTLDVANQRYHTLTEAQRDRVINLLCEWLDPKGESLSCVLFCNPIIKHRAILAAKLGV